MKQKILVMMITLSFGLMLAGLFLTGLSFQGALAQNVQQNELSPATSYLVEGYVTDAHTGWPLYANIFTHTSTGGFWNDPETGYYSVTLPENITFTFEITTWVKGYLPITRTIGPLSGDTNEDFAIEANLSTCEAPGYQFNYAFYDDFENGYTNWIMDGLWNSEAESDTCGSLVTPFPSPSNAAYYGIDSTCTYSNGIRNTGSLTMAYSVTVPSGAELLFSSFEETECNDGDEECVYDNRYIEIRDITTTTWDTLGEGVAKGYWYQKAFDLSPYSGKSVLLRFRFDSYDSIDNDFFGWMVDDVSIGLECVSPISGGLVVGNIYNLITHNPLVGAEVTNDSGEAATALSTPDDPNVDEAFYTLFSPSGNRVFTATYTALFGPAVETVTVVEDDTIRQDFWLSTPVIYLPFSIKE